MTTRMILLVVAPSEYDEMFAEAYRKEGDYLLTQVKCGEYTGMADASGCHGDNFGKCDGALIENKTLAVLGNPEPSVAISTPDGRIPLGALAYPSFKVYTTNFAMVDIELHQLHGEMHWSSRSTPGDCRRGAWYRP